MRGEVLLHPGGDPAGQRSVQSAAAALFLEHEPRVRAYVSFRIRNQADVDEMVGEVFRRVLGSRPPAEPDASRAWLFRIAHNLVVDHYKRRRFLTLPLLDFDRPDDAPSLSDRLIHDERLHAIDLAMARLPGRQRAAIYLRYYEELGYEDVASVMGTPVVTVRSLVHRGLKHLATGLRGWEVE
jgi:RNA polymerase sigma factor (sigma-70 family)